MNRSLYSKMRERERERVPRNGSGGGREEAKGTRDERVTKAREYHRREESQMR